MTLNAVPKVKGRLVWYRMPVRVSGVDPHVVWLTGRAAHRPPSSILRKYML